MRRVKITLSYDGSKYYGFQIQSKKTQVPTVAGALTQALEELNAPCKIIGSGRTDRGVHASEQVAHTQLPPYWQDLEKLKEKCNKFLAPSIIIKKIEPVAETFHARYSAKKRVYRYVFYSSEQNPFYANYALHVANIDTKKLNAIAKNFIGVHDFVHFKKSENKSTCNIREIYSAGAYSYQNFTILYFCGSSFLRSQVRIMSSFALRVMQDELSISQLQAQLRGEAKYCSQPLEPQGLYLAKIHY